MKILQIHKKLLSGAFLLAAAAGISTAANATQYVIEFGGYSLSFDDSTALEETNFILNGIRNKAAAEKIETTTSYKPAKWIDSVTNETTYGISRSGYVYTESNDSFRQLDNVADLNTVTKQTYYDQNNQLITRYTADKTYQMKGHQTLRGYNSSSFNAPTITDPNNSFANGGWGQQLISQLSNQVEHSIQRYWEGPSLITGSAAYIEDYRTFRDHSLNISLAPNPNSNENLAGVKLSDSLLSQELMDCKPPYCFREFNIAQDFVMNLDTYPIVNYGMYYDNHLFQNNYDILVKDDGTIFDGNYNFGESFSNGSVSFIFGVSTRSGQNPNDAFMPYDWTNGGAIFSGNGSGSTTRAFYDPEIATGYIFEITEDGEFSEINIANQYGDGLFDLNIWDEESQSFVFSREIEFGSWTDITDLNLKKFSITGIETPLDPQNPQAFVTGLTFSLEDVIFSMNPITTYIPDPPPTTTIITLNGGSSTMSPEYLATLSPTPVNQVPVPAAAWLMGSGLVGLAGIARRKKYN